MEVTHMENNFLKDSLIYKRHSVRKYQPDPVKQEHLDHILHAAMAAPSAHNSQPWAFVVIDDRKLLDACADFHKYGKMLFKASAAILVCAIREVVKENLFYQQDIGAAVENILLAATECGVGSCWCGIHPKPEIEKPYVELLHIPEEYFPFAIVALGYMNEEPLSSDRYDASRVYHNGW